MGVKSDLLATVLFMTYVMKEMRTVKETAYDGHLHDIRHED